ncbi:hypothetical protein CTAYLR_003192 [Chrysophaeum taylorii]|uniref:monoamine oxidase n=1 Tax=Chrysophaeum taylorii TaxID=2483200 RepID=A0AAD7UB75_9STRA|nr:hypothetical protein CTAYLR_003192 [Chrysophaeum taylorii]
MGGAWSWPSDRGLARLGDELGVRRVPQAAEGLAVVDSYGTEPDTGAAGPGAVRFEGGAQQLAEKLAVGLRVTLDAPVSAIRVEKGVACETQKETVRGRCAVVTAPPRVAAAIEYEPELSRKKKAAMESTMTWMGEATKIGLKFPKPFWKEKGFSGNAYSNQGPLTQVWDNSDDEGESVLAGFMFGPPEDDEAVMVQLRRIFGDVPEPTSTVRTSWGTEPWTFRRPPSGAANTRQFGRPELSTPHHDVVFFAGTETYPEHGHIEGAVQSAYRVSKEVQALLLT